MTRKVKLKKHTAKQITAKVDSATTNSGCGNAGLADRSGIENGEFEYPLCKVTTTDIKSMQIHHVDCHPKIPFAETKITGLHRLHRLQFFQASPRCPWIPQKVVNF